MPSIALVVAMAENGVIGDANRLPWRLPADLRHFKAVTLGKPILMGRKTFQSIGAPLAGRRNLVLTRDRQYSASGIETVAGIDEALRTINEAPELMVIGGAEVYGLALAQAQCIYLTRVHANIVGDTYFPKIDWTRWREVERRDHPVDEKNAFAMTFLKLTRRL